MKGADAVPFRSIPIERLRGVGPKIAPRLREKGIHTKEDLLYVCPISYENRLTVSTIAEAEEGNQGSFVGRVVSSGSTYYRHARKRGFQAVLDDGTGSISLNWFNFSRHHVEKLCEWKGDLFVAGVVTRFGAQLQIVHPHIAPVIGDSLKEHCKIVPTYSEIQGVGQGITRKLVAEAFRSMEPAGFQSLIPPREEKSRRILPLHQAMSLIHFPGDASDLGLLAEARSRLVLEEFFSFQAALFLKKEGVRAKTYVPQKDKSSYSRQFLASVPFQPTAAQKRAMKEIRGDMGRSTPMNRLLQGDVGSGKTLCAVFAACTALDKGYQVAFIAPTEILAEQHYLSIQSMVAPTGVGIALLTASAGHERGEILKGLEKGGIRFVVGTHALFEEDVRFSRLGLVIIDEQHKFGVLQRKAIIDKAFFPNILAVTATPIPRTLSIVFYGDLDVSVIDEAPPGRGPIKTEVWDDTDRSEVYRLVLDEIKEGGLAYLVFPIIEEQDGDGLSGVRNQFERLAEGPFQGYRVGMLHGRMTVGERDGIMKRFREGEIQILVSTTVIEVGLDLPDATVMVIHHAERFGLAQLHQLRGRVGRGQRESVCILLTGQDGSEVSKERLRIMKETNDGFRIAEADMMLRGPGEILGVRQSGLPKFRLGDVLEDGAVMREARKLAQEALPGLEDEELLQIRETVFERWGENLGLMGIS